MEWIKVCKSKDIRDQFPVDDVFLAIWNSWVCLCEYNDETDRYYVNMLPTQYKPGHPVDNLDEYKFTHYMPIQYPQE